MQTSLASLTAAVTRVPTQWFLVAVALLSAAFYGLAKVGIRVLVQDVAVLLPEYAVAVAAALLILGLLDSGVRGLLLTALGSAIVAVAVVSLVAFDYGRWDVFLFALPLTMAGAAGLGMFAHGVLHAAPATARKGFNIIIGGYVLSVVFGVIGLRFLEFREEIYGTDPATIAIGVGSALALVAAMLLLYVGHRRREDGTGGTG